jgi:hypothetical protein
VAPKGKREYGMDYLKKSMLDAEVMREKQKQADLRRQGEGPRGEAHRVRAGALRRWLFRAAAFVSLCACAEEEAAKRVEESKKNASKGKAQAVAQPSGSA